MFDCMCNTRKILCFALECQTVCLCAVFARALWTSYNFDVTTSNVSFLRGSNTQLRDVTAGPFTAGPLSDVTPLQCTADPTPEPHGQTSSRAPSHSFLVVTSIATIGTFEATRF